ncbi:MAG: hypothetical protein MZV63_01890 [Marinilabiliales bacterium]|nr:hypothetical protein [Marinilabiliales bacterium]
MKVRPDKHLCGKSDRHCPREQCLRPSRSEYAGESRSDKITTGECKGWQR